ncbi:MAG: hypothetical protein Q7K57_36865 [Burkholderiaceae bacterium]|nr:hypothetical protein [Burkholderiaceae bacterium]
MHAFDDSHLRFWQVQGKAALRQLLALMATGQNAVVPDALESRRQHVLQ